MANISKSPWESVYNITRWHGVNEAAEGEASLKLGEAAVMRNFRVTSGGALKKRPGSRNVAGLLSKYTARVREERRLLFTDGGDGEGHELFPRMDVDDLGAIHVGGSPETVAGSGAGEYSGWYLDRAGIVYRLAGVETDPAAGNEKLTGGACVTGTLSRICSGVVRTDPSGAQSHSGEWYLDTHTQAAVKNIGGKITAGVAGRSVRRAAPTRREVGWDSENMGGYFQRDGKLWKYYGIRVDTYVPYRNWKKFKCSYSRTVDTWYEEGEFVNKGTFYSLVNANGYTGYSFNRKTGVYTTTGSYIRVTYDNPGTIYQSGAGTSIVRNEVHTGYNTLYRSDAQGPFEKVNLQYSINDYVEDVAVEVGKLPEADRGFEYVDTLDLDGVAYTVMREGTTYYCYTLNNEAAEFYESAYSFWANPLSDIKADTFRWYFNETYSETSVVTDTVVRGIWSGYVGGREVLCAACGGALWELKMEDNGVPTESEISWGEEERTLRPSPTQRGGGGKAGSATTWSKISAGEMDTSRDVHMFGFDEKLYILNGQKYLVWDGARLEEVEGYRPLVSVSVEPGGGGTLLENVNRLTAGRRCWFSPDGAATVFQLPETDIKSVDWVKEPGVDDVSGDTGEEEPSFDGDERALKAAAANYTVDLAAGTVTFVNPPAKGINSLEIAWSAKEDMRGQVTAMRFAETYNGAQDTRVFIYGDGTNRTFYSGLDHEGRARADYFPDLCEAAVGDANTPITALIRHYNKLMAFKPDSAWSIGYDTITLIDGTVTAGFTVTPVNRSIGNCAYGQAQLVMNRPRTLDGRSVIEWKATSSSGITGDQRNAERVSQRVDSSIRQFDLTKARTFYDKFSHEYYVIGEDGTAIVQNLDVDAWYVYTGLDLTCMINYRDELYYGTRDGYLRHFSDRYFSDNGEAIDAVWESGAMSFSEDFRRKYSATVWIGIKPEDNGYLEVTAETDRKSDFAVYSFGTSDAAGVPEMERIKLKAKKFTYYKLILSSDNPDKTVTVVSADIRVRGTGYVR